MLWKIVAGLALLVGLATGIGSIVGAAKKSPEIVAMTISIAGLVAFVGIFLFSAWVARQREFSKYRLVRTGASLSFFAFAVYGIVSWDFEELVIPSLIVVSLISIFGILFFLRIHSQSRTTCIDCAETIKVDAKVCPHCGFRYEDEPPRPPRPPEAAAPA